MHKKREEAVSLAIEIKEKAKDYLDKVSVVVCPPFTVLGDVYRIIKDSPVKLGAQDIFWEREGAFTGEISPIMLKDVGCSFVIIGHSERRKYFGEDNEIVNKKVKSALMEGLIPIVCVGEKLEERNLGKTLEVVDDQIKGALKDLKEEDLERVVIAYEPVWAIGTGINATPSQAEEVHSFIRKTIKELYSLDISKKILILYGGSVSPKNIEDLIKEEDIDGALVGGASLKSDSFAEIIKITSKYV